MGRGEKAKAVKPAKTARKKATRKKASQPWTLETMRECAKKLGGVGLFRSYRTYDPLIHQSDGRVFFIFTEQEKPGFRVRQFHPSNGLTRYSGTRVYKTSGDAHKAAELLLQLPPELEG